MQLGTLDRTPPPFFRQGYSARTKLVFFAALAVFLMVADTRIKLVAPLRVVIANALHPVELTLLKPVQLLRGGSEYFQGLQEALNAETQLRKALAAQSEHAARADRLLAENASLRALLTLRPTLQVKSIPAEVLYEASDPYSRKLFIDRGTTDGVAPGAPVINDAGVLGQVTRVYRWTSEVTLLTDKDAAIPVLNSRTQQRSAAFGGVALGTRMELRFVAGNADVKEGDLLATSGVDGVYPPGLAVAKVVNVERQADAGFARILLAPVAPADAVRHVLVLEPVGLQMPARPAPEGDDAAPAAKGKKAKK